MKRNMLILTISFFVPAFFSFQSYLFAQCFTSNIVGDLTAPATGVKLGQSFTMTGCNDGRFTSIVILSASNTSNITLKIFPGDGINGTPQYVQYDVAFTIVNGDNIITLAGGDGSLDFIGGNTYSFSMETNGEMQLAKSNLNPYPGGTMYDATGNPVTGQDLVFTVNSSATALPVELSEFDVRKEKGYALLTWKTASENGNAGFEVERGADGQSWETLAFVEGFGTTTEAHEYSYLDKNPLEGANYYRLRQMDFNGGIGYSPIMVLRMSGNAGEPAVFPNPASPGNTISISNIAPGMKALTLLEMSGKPLRKMEIHEGESTVFFLPIDLPKGVYFIVLRTEGRPVQKRILVQ